MTFAAQYNLLLWPAEAWLMHMRSGKLHSVLGLERPILGLMFCCRSVDILIISE